MDEAGGFAFHKLIRLVDAVFILLPAPDHLLRTLTLGILIVSGGTLAALPFRRYQAIPDASSAPAQVTGPMQSVLESANPATLATTPAESQAPVDFASHDFRPAVRQYSAANHRRTAFAPSPQRADIPLSYQDLEVPIDQPDPIKQRFNAAAPIRAEQLALERAAGFQMPKTETLAASQVQQIKSVASKFVDVRKEESTVTGSLASAREAVADQLPQRDDSGRERHWIRQPD